MFLSVAFFFFLSLYALLGLSSPAYAYLDPGTGSMIIQAIIGAIVGAGVALRLFWHRIVIFFRGSKEQPSQVDDAKDS